MIAAPESRSPRPTPSPVAQALRQRIAEQQAARGVPAAPPPAPPVVPPPRVRTPGQALARDGASVGAVVSVVLGLVTLVLGWRGVAGTLDVQAQIAFMVSGGLVGLALVGLGCAFATIQVERFVEAQENHRWRLLARRWTDLGAAVTEFSATLVDAPADEAGP